MYESYQELGAPGRRRSSAAIAVSIAAHCIILFLVCRRPDAIFVQPTLVARGDMGKSVLIYSPSAPAAPKVKVTHKQDLLTFKHNSTIFAPRYTGTKAPQKDAKTRPVEEASTSVRYGTRNGSVYEGTTLGTDIQPAIPTLFPDPALSTLEVPGVEGDVVVEITIDEAGNVVETKVLKSLGYGIEEKVVAALHNWHFRPATKDGSPIPSKQDYRFHFPS
jgi:TonB family protein